WGSLDYALANGSLNSQVSGSDKWHINADEPVVLDYGLSFKSASQQSLFYSDDPFRSSNHDPVIVGLNLTGSGPTEPVAPVVVSTPAPPTLPPVHEWPLTGTPSSSP
ncbi:MAG: endonuclease, partial [Cyanobacteriota bacterium]